MISPNKVAYLWPKVIYFTLFAGFGALMPYLPVFYHSEGLNETYIGLLGAVTPAMGFFAGPIWGVAADR
jgi:MFS family permease